MITTKATGIRRYPKCEVMFVKKGGHFSHVDGSIATRYVQSFFDFAHLFFPTGLYTKKVQIYIRAKLKKCGRSPKIKAPPQTHPNHIVLHVMDRDGLYEVIVLLCKADVDILRTDNRLEMISSLVSTDILEGGEKTFFVDLQMCLIGGLDDTETIEICSETISQLSILPQLTISQGGKIDLTTEQILMLCHYFADHGKYVECIEDHRFRFVDDYFLSLLLSTNILSEEKGMKEYYQNLRDRIENNQEIAYKSLSSLQLPMPPLITKYGTEIEFTPELGLIICECFARKNIYFNKIGPGRYQFKRRPPCKSGSFPKHDVKDVTSARTVKLK